MHMADALLSPAVGGSFWAGTVATIGYCARRLKDRIDDRMIPLMGVSGAFIFAAQMINFTIPGTGSSGHLGGGLILAATLGPHAAFLAMASVLTVQALFFADGGLLALGCNIWNLGVYPCFVAFPLIYRPLAGNGTSPRIVLASVASAVAGLQLGAFSVVLQTLLSGKSELPFGSFLLAMQPIHLAIGLVEGFVTAAVLNYVRAARPEILEGAAGARPPGSEVSPGKVLRFFLLLAVVSGGALSWVASTHPDGLEWSIEKAAGKGELSEPGAGVADVLRKVQEKTAFLPDYGFKPSTGRDGRKAAGAPGEATGAPKPVGEARARPGPDAGTSLSGLLGAGIVLLLTVLAGIGIRAFRGRSSP